MNTALEDRMKENYENRHRIKLIRRMPVILRLDGKAFHTYTRGFNKPFDIHLVGAFQNLATFLLNEIQGAKVAYTESDELSLMLTDFDTLETDAWFDYNLQKMVSVAASMATGFFNEYMKNVPALEDMGLKLAFFDCRAFNIPKEEAANYFVCRQQDCSRNAISATAQSRFSHKQLQGKSCKEMLELLGGGYETDVLPACRFGFFVRKTEPCVYIGDIKENREFIEDFLKTE